MEICGRWRVCVCGSRYARSYDFVEAGRQDRDVAFCTPDGRLPDGSKDQNHIRTIFGRMGFDDREMVALCGAQ
jgi:hypothetical protein